jgi:hypothetical protein
VQNRAEQLDRPANASSDYTSSGQARNTLKPIALAPAYSSTLVFPMPDSPWMINAELRPPRAPALRSGRRFAFARHLAQPTRAHLIRRVAAAE